MRSHIAQNPMQLMSSFPQFMNEMRGKNPQQILNDMRANGVTDEMINQATEMANSMNNQFNQFRNMFGFK